METPETQDVETNEVVEEVQEVQEVQEDVTENVPQENSEIAELKRQLELQRAQIAENRQETEYFRNMVAQSQKPRTKEYDVEDIPDYGGVEKVVSSQVNSVREELRQDRLLLQVQNARDKYSDWQDAYDAITAACQVDPGMEAAIMNSKNPAETAYKLGSAELIMKGKKSLEKKATKKTVDKINNNLNSPQTLSSSGGGGSISDVGKYAKMTDQQMEEEISRIKYG